MRERLARWIKTTAPADSLTVDAGHAELPSRSAAEAQGVFTAMLGAITVGV